MADGTREALDLRSNDLGNVAKIAVIWQQPVDLDLHALEYAAQRGGPGHVWAKAPGQSEQALRTTQSTGRGRGFISQSDDGSNRGDKIEVYTFWLSEQQRSGVVELSIDYATRGSTPSGDHCGNGPLASIPVTVVRSIPGQPVSRTDALLAALPCGQPLAELIRYNQTITQHLSFRR